MDISHFVVAFLTSILLHSESDCRELNGYKFPVFTTEFCPRNISEWNKRASAFNCTVGSTYACFPNNNISELIEFCFPLQTIPISKGVCVFLSEGSTLEIHNCKTFSYGCPDRYYSGSTIYNYPSCVSIGNGCFLAEPSCKSTTTSTTTSFIPGITTTQRITTQHTEEWPYIITFVTLFFILISLFGVYFKIKKKLKRGVAKNDHGDLHVERRPLLKLEDNEINVVEDKGIDNYIFEKWQEEDELFFATNASREVERMLHDKNLVVVAGHPGCGKSTIIQHVALGYRKRGWMVKPVFVVEEIIEACALNKRVSNKTLFVFNDPIGKDFVDDILCRSWKKFEEKLNLFLRSVKLLVTCRKSILHDVRVNRLFLLKEESIVCIVDENQNKLNDQEKKEIFKKHNPNTDLNVMVLNDILKIETYFPLLCKLFVDDSKGALDQRIFFREPKEVYETEINNLKIVDKEKYCGLVCLVLFDNEICSDDLTKKIKLFKTCLRLCNLPEFTSPVTITHNLELLIGLFVTKIGKSYQFANDFVKEVTTLVLGADYPTETIMYANIGFLRRNVKLGNCFDLTDSCIITLSWNHLVDRFFQEMFKDRFMEVILNPCLRNENITNGFIRKLKDCPKKMQLMIKEIQIKFPKHEQDCANKKQCLSILTFLNLKRNISPLFALISLGHNRLALFCLRALKQAQQNFRNENLFLAVCCNGSTDLFNMFSKEEKCMETRWGSLNPIDILSAFHNYEHLNELLKMNKNEHGIKNKVDDITTLTLTIYGNSQRSLEQVENCQQSRRDKTIQVLLDNRYEVNGFSRKGIIPLCSACKQECDSTEQLLWINGANVELCNNHEASPLSSACENGYDSTVKLLVKYGADVNLCNNGGYSPLYRACKNGCESTVRLLLDYGAKVNVCTKEGKSPLSTASENGYDSTVQLLLTYGADVNLCNNGGYSPLYRACENGCESTVRLLLKNGAEVNLCTKDGNSPLSTACENGYYSTVLLDDKGEPNHLFKASEKGHASIARLLLNNGADVNLCNKDGYSPLFKGSANGHDSIVQLLLNNGADVNLCNEDGCSPLFIGSENGHDSIVQLLLKYGADVNLCNKDKYSPLAKGCENAHTIIVQLLLKNGADVNLCNKDGYSPLVKGSENGHDNIVQLLLNNGADVNLCNKDGYSPLFKGSANGHDSIVQLLLNNGADVNLCNKDGYSPLFKGSENGHDNIVQLLLKNGADVNLCNKDGSSPLFKGSENGHDIIVHLLLKNGADVNLCNEDGSSPLFKGSENGHDSIVQLLLKNGADVNLCNKDGSSPLFKGSENGHDIIVHLLLKNGADVNLCNKEGISPLMIARGNRHESTVQILLDYGAAKI
uniref:Uncharacterized protein LOC111099549 isoform X2 n=1 Tax=Crassostrea virginica TaxID=6565 RepID=A0A8B8A512_CRAVI|nr:uncharacterized protein LOC111099549 isoform X2 [Crassostrea virginica]